MPPNETITEVVRTFLEEYIKNLEATIADVVEEILKAKIAELSAVIEERAKPGLSGKNGVSPDKNEIIREVISLIPTPKNGRDGKDADEIKIEMNVLSRLPPPKIGPPGKDGIAVSGEVIVKKINILELVPDKQIDASHIKNLISLIKKYSDHGIMLRGGGGITLETPTGTVNGINTIFDVTMSPKYLIIDGISKFQDVHYTLTGSRINIIDGAPPVQYLRAII